MGWVRRSFQKIIGERTSKSSGAPDKRIYFCAEPKRIHPDDFCVAQAIASNDEVEVDRDKILEVARWVSGVGESHAIKR